MLKAHGRCQRKARFYRTRNGTGATNSTIKKELNMPFIIAGVVKSMALSVLGNSGVIEKVIILLLETLAKKSDSDVDDKLVALLKKSLEKKA
jgi:hypothetical protein